ncbi:MAG: MerR family transcriptional regulator [Acidimicrobiia bacterium]
MRIGEVSDATGLEASAIRFYERQGVLPAPDRTDSGYRDYSEANLELVRFVKRARSLGFPLDDIREIVELRLTGRAPCDAVRAVIAREASLIESRIQDLQLLQGELKHLRRLADEVADDWPRGDCVCHIVQSGFETKVEGTSREATS